MSFPLGIRDGAFVRFDNVDVNGHDVGLYFQDLSGQARVDALKAAALRYGSRFFAFNSGGYAKSWSTLNASMFGPGKATLYIRVEYPGWTFYPDKESTGNDLGNVNLNVVPAIVEKINERKNPYEVVAFNTNGYIKRAVTFPLTSFISNSSIIEGTYVRNDV
ncbi:hypothetical protein M378DRAFT_170165 [Amanita muscaria Koide BX008]|uniref:Uncharacterized protein n=1 Tax=Amanita muscaria (strain Koide BX008) TaxID=946122 RepID=A0A0C2SXD3_AMAMK|nr:hypothetical protein M378DRAFT_170165 [Amanita muscaria Koide BX008]